MKSKSTLTKICLQGNAYEQMHGLAGKAPLNPFTRLGVKMGALILALLLTSSLAQAAVRTSTATGGAWGTGSTWVGGVAPTATDQVVIATTGTNSVTGIASGTTYTCAGLTINSGSILTMQRDFIVNGVTSISGTINFGSTSGSVRAMAFNGAVTLNSGAVWNETTTGAAATFSFSSSFTNSATTFTAQNTAHTFTGPGTLSGSTATVIPTVTFTGNYTNSGTLTSSTLLTVTGAAIRLTNDGIITATTALSGTGGITQGATGVLNIGAASAITTLTATAVGNTVNYTGAGQTVKGTIYDILNMAGSGTKTLGAATTANGNLSVNPGVTLATSNFSLTLGGNFTNGGTFTGGSSNIIITGTATQSIAGFTTTGTVSMTKASGTATFAGNANGGGITFSGGASGTLSLGAALTHVFTGTFDASGGTLNGGSSTIRLGGGLTGTTGITFNPESGTVDWNSAGDQTIAQGGYNNLILSGGGTKTVPPPTTVAGGLTIDGTAVADLSGDLNTANALYFGTSQQIAGTWGSLTSTNATNKNSHFLGLGLVTIATGGCVAPVITGQPANQTVTYGTNASFTVTATGDGLTYQWQEFISTWTDIADGGVYSNATTPTLNLTKPGVSLSTNKYRCVVTGSCGSATSDGSATLTIGKQTLTETGTVALDKEYDGTTTAAFTVGSLSGFVTGETVTATAAGTFDSKDAGSRTTTAVFTLLDGTGGGLANNYSLANTTGLTANIIEKTLSVSGSSAAGKEYDGTTTATITVGSLSGFVTGETVTATATGTFNSKDVGSRTATAVYTLVDGTGGGLASNYSLANTSGHSANITAKALSVSGSIAAGKIYDGTTTAAITVGSLSGFVTGETVTATATGTFSSKDAGSRTATAVYSLVDGTGGGLAANYSLGSSTGLTANITPKALTVTGSVAEDKVYDGTTDATITVGALSDFVGTETVTATATGVFDGKDAGSNTAIATYTLVDGTNGGLAINYSLGSTTGLVANISPKALNVTGSTAADKTYDGTTTAVITVGTLSGFVTGESLTATATGTFDSKNVGARTATAVYSLINGADGLAINYSLANTTGIAANITELQITITPDAGQSKVVGAADPPFTFTFSPALISPDIMNGSLGRASGSSVGVYAFTLGDLSAGTNYTIVMVASPATFEIKNVTGIEDVLANNGLKLKNYPNPFSVNTTISYSLPSDGRVSITILNLAGQTVKTIVSEMETNGDYTINAEVSDLQSGIYFATIRLNSNGKELTKTIRIMKLK